MSHLRWFDEFKRLGYRIERARSGHWKVLDPAGSFVTSISATLPITAATGTRKRSCAAMCDTNLDAPSETPGQVRP